MRPGSPINHDTPRRPRRPSSNSNSPNPHREVETRKSTQQYNAQNKKNAERPQAMLQFTSFTEPDAQEREEVKERSERRQEMNLTSRDALSSGELPCHRHDAGTTCYAARSLGRGATQVQCAWCRRWRWRGGDGAQQRGSHGCHFRFESNESSAASPSLSPEYKCASRHCPLLLRSFVPSL